MSKNALAKKMKQREDRISMERAEIRSQIDCDAAVMAANDIFQMGPSRARAFVEKMAEYEDEIARMFLDDAKADETLEYSKVTLDRRIKEIVGEENFSPGEVRYGRRIFR